MNKKILMGAIAALSIASASAEDIYISGATAYRGTANAAIAAFVSARGGSITTSNNATLNSATLLKASFTTNSAVHNIYVRWTGSEGGIQSCAGPRSGSNAVTVKFYNVDVASGLQTNSSAANNSKVTDIAFSDTYQATSLYAKKFAGVAYSTLRGYTGSGDGIVGVNQFAFITGSNNPASNISSMQARTLLANGTVPTALLTGNRAHDGTGSYLVGRNSDSGTRLSVLGEVGYGANTKPQQYRVNSKSSIELFPAETINGLALNLGESGYSSGGTVGEVFTLGANYPLNDDVLGDGTYSSNYIIGYAGAGDALANTAGDTRANIKVLSFNGVPFTMDNIKNGTYSLWTYEHLYYNAAASTLAQAVARSIGAACLNTASAKNAAVKMTDMAAERAGDAAPVTTTY
jgi:hypothetical protein